MGISKLRIHKPEEVKVSGIVKFEPATLAVVEEIMLRTGMRGEVSLARVKVLEGPDKGKTLRRNIRGVVRPGDLIMLAETEIDARALKREKRGEL